MDALRAALEVQSELRDIISDKEHLLTCAQAENARLREELEQSEEERERRRAWARAEAGLVLHPDKEIERLRAEIARWGRSEMEIMKEEDWAAELRDAHAEIARLKEELTKKKPTIRQVERRPLVIDEEEPDARDAEIERLREALHKIADFAPGYGDVCEIIAKTARRALMAGAE